jgi:hypothetical protein
MSYNVRIAYLLAIEHHQGQSYAPVSSAWQRHADDGQIGR